MRHHMLIAGTGRAGTSLLVRILDACGLETGLSFEPKNTFWEENANAGIENIPILGEHHPYVVKSPWSYQFLRELLARPDIKLDAVLLPIRKLEEAAASRIVLELRHRYEHVGDVAFLEDTWRDWGVVAGGVTYSLEPLDQARILAYSLHRIIESLVAHDIPIHFLDFPQFVTDIGYLHSRLIPILPNKLSFPEFSDRVSSIIDAGKVRITKELAKRGPETATFASLEAQSHDVHELPSFETLDQIALKRELKSAISGIRETKAEASALREKCDAIAVELDNAKVELARLESLKQAIDERDQRIAMLVDEIRGMVQSASWRITAPLRMAVGWGRKPNDTKSGPD